MSGGGWHWRAVWRASTRAPHDAQPPRYRSGGRGDSSRESESKDSEDSDAVGVLPLRAASQHGQAAAGGCGGGCRGTRLSSTGLAPDQLPQPSMARCARAGARVVPRVTGTSEQ